MVSPHRPGVWVTELSADRRSCRLLGYPCVADFEITNVALAPLAWEIFDKLVNPELALSAGRCDTINIGLYDKGNDIRIWKVNRIDPPG